MRQAMRNRRRNLERLARNVPRGLSSTEDVLEVAQLLWKQIDTPVSLKLSLLVEHGQLTDALAVEFQPSRYLDSDWTLARDDYQAISFLRKFPFEVPGIDRSASALKKFLEAEELCRTTNIRYRDYLYRGKITPRVDRVINTARRKIRGWLGSLNASSWALRCRFGPGVDALNKGACVSAYHKLSHLSVTPDFRDGALGLVRSHPVWNRILAGGPDLSYNPGPCKELSFDENLMKVVPGNRVTFVPKTALTDRSIAIEPGMNIFAQLGLGALIRGRLKRAGLDLDDQTPNQVLALRGSRNEGIATIDLSSASDTLAIEVVRDLVPEEWYVALDWCRSKTGTYLCDGKETTLRYEKFSSMGNGFTFELESMVFYALALSCADEISSGLEDPRETVDYSVIRSYGDDITVPTNCVKLLAEVLSFCGFLFNEQKSFSSGPFRESCGADFFNGKNIRPYFLKEFCGTAQSLFRLANGIRRAAYRRNLGYGCDSKLRPVWVHVVSRIPNSLRDLRIPFRPVPVKGWDDVESGDGGLAVNLDEALSSPYVRFNRDYMAGWLFADLQARPSSQKVGAEGWEFLYLFALYSCRDGCTSETTTYDQVVGRGESGRRLRAGAFTPAWFDLGPWA